MDLSTDVTPEIVGVSYLTIPFLVQVHWACKNTVSQIFFVRQGRFDKEKQSSQNSNFSLVHRKAHPGQFINTLFGRTQEVLVFFNQLHGNFLNGTSPIWERSMLSWDPPQGTKPQSILHWFQRLEIRFCVSLILISIRSFRKVRGRVAKSIFQMQEENPWATLFVRTFIRSSEWVLFMKFILFTDFKYAPKLMVQITSLW